MTTYEGLERRLEEVTYCLGKALARLRIVEEKLKYMEQQPLSIPPEPAAQSLTPY